MGILIFERPVIIAESYETLHKVNSTWLYAGYGLMKQLPGNKYGKGYKIHEREADALFRKELHKFCGLYAKYETDQYLIEGLAYNYGSEVVNRNSVIAKLKRGYRDIYTAYTTICRNKVKSHECCISDVLRNISSCSSLK